MLEQAGFTVDDFTDITWNDFMEKAKVVKEKTGQPILTSQAGSPDLVMEMLQSCGESLFNEDGSVNIVDNKALKPILEIYSQMVKDGTLVEVTDWDQYIASINNGTTAGVINGCWIMASIQQMKISPANGQSPICRNWTALTEQPTTPTTVVLPGQFLPTAKNRILPLTL